MIFIIHSSDQYTKYLKANRNDRELEETYYQLLKVNH